MIQIDKYFTRNQLDVGAYLIMPLDFFKDERFADLSLSAKVLYSFMLNRVQLSLKNNWVDEQGRIFHKMTIDDVAAEVGVSRATAVKLKKELIHFGLLEEVKRFSKASVLYLIRPSSIEIKPQKSKNYTTSEVQNLNHSSIEIKPQKFKNYTTEVQNLNSSKLNTNNINTNKLNRTSCTSSASVSSVMSFLDETWFRNTGKRFGEFELEELAYRLNDDKFPPEVIVEAIKETVLNDKTNFKYLNSILKRWKLEGLMTVESVRENIEAFEAKKQGGGHPPKRQGSNVPGWSNPDYENTTTEEEKIKLAELKNKVAAKLKGKGN